MSDAELNRAELDAAPMFSMARGPHEMLAVKIPSDRLGTRRGASWMVVGPAGWSILRITLANADSWTLLRGIEPGEVHNKVGAALRGLAGLS